MEIASPQSSRLVWETHLTELKALGKIAVRLIFLHANSFGFKCNASFLRWISANAHSRAVMDRAQKLIFVAACSKLQSFRGRTSLMMKTRMQNFLSWKMVATLICKSVKLRCSVFRLQTLKELLLNTSKEGIVPILILHILED